MCLEQLGSQQSRPNNCKAWAELQPAEVSQPRQLARPLKSLSANYANLYWRLWFYAFLVLICFISFGEPSLLFAKTGKGFLKIRWLCERLPAKILSQFDSINVWRVVQLKNIVERVIWVIRTADIELLHLAKTVTGISWEYVNSHGRRNHWRTFQGAKFANSQHCIKKLSEN